jgi:hypothetical protein
MKKSFTQFTLKSVALGSKLRVMSSQIPYLDSHAAIFFLILLLSVFANNPEQAKLQEIKISGLTAHTLSSSPTVKSIAVVGEPSFSAF